MCVPCALFLGCLALGVAGTTQGLLKVGFVGDDLSEANPYVRGFDFWVSFVNQHQDSGRAGFWVEGKPFNVSPVRAQYNASADQAWVQRFAEDWAKNNIWMVVLAVPISRAWRYSEAFSSLGINHIEVVTSDTARFRQLAKPGLFGILPPADGAASGFLSLAAPRSSGGLCSLTSTGIGAEDELDGLGPTATAGGGGGGGAAGALVPSAVAQAAQQGVLSVLASDFRGGGGMEETAAFMRNYSQAVVESGCDILIAHVEGPAACALQEALANASAPLVAELILPQPDGSLWAPLGKKGEHVFTATPWHHGAHQSCRVFDDTGHFLQEFRQWHMDNFHVDRLPSVEEAMAVAGAVTFQVAGKVKTWFPEKERSQLPESWQELAEELAEEISNGTLEVDTEDSYPDLPYLFFYRMRKSLEAFDRKLFFGDVSFDSSGARSGASDGDDGGAFVTLQYFENASEVAVRPLDSTTGVAVVPMDSFQSREGCPLGTVRHFGEPLDSITLEVLGAAELPSSSALSGSSTPSSPVGAPANMVVHGAKCVLCSGTLEYQDERDQPRCKLCPAGHVPSPSRGACVPCSPGTFRQEEDEECRPCLEGEFASSPASTTCQPCPMGEFARGRGHSACEPCPSGSVSPEEGARNCFPCTAGYSTEGQSGASRCLPCERGFYSEGMSSPNCTACPDSFGTEEKAAESLAKCVCPPGSYWHRAAPESEPRCEARHCDGALLCDGWSNGPPLVAALYSGGAEPFEGAGPAYLVRCASREDCPGGLPLGMCPETRADVPGCGLCEDGFSKHLGECVLCSETPQYVPFVVLAIFVLSTVAIIYGVHSRDYSVDSKALLRILATAGIAIPALQILVVFRFIDIDWPEPIAAIHTFYAAALEPMKLMNLKCMLSVTKAWQSYLSVVLLWPVVASLLFAVLVIPRWLPAPLSRTVSKKRIFQSEGLLVLTLYTSISMLSLSPWQCEANPDGTSSVLAHREVLCWDSHEHAAMLAMSTLALLVFVVGFISVVAWATYQYPIRVQGPNGLEFLTRFGWIFSRYKSEKYYYGLAYCARNLLVTIVPVIFAGNIPLQLLLVACMLQVSFGLQCWVQPWRTSAANKLDAACSVLLILTLVAACVLLDLDPSNMKALVSAFFSITWGLLALGVAWLLCQNAYLWCVPHRKYSFFLCHHKQGAAMLARWVKIQLKLRQQGEVFLDSDMLHRVDTLFEAVGHQTENFVVLLTKETLERIWCAGEIATAMQCKVHTVLIACNDYEEPTDEFINKLGDVWSSAQLTEVAQQGVALGDIQESYRTIRDMRKVRLDRASGAGDQAAAVEAVLSLAEAAGGGGALARRASFGRATSGGRGSSSGEASAGGGPGSREPRPARASGQAAVEQGASRTPSPGCSTRISNLVVGNWADSETLVVCRVVQLLLQPHIHTPIHIASTDLDEAIAQLGQLEQPARIAVVLTRGVLESPAFAAFLAKAVRADAVRPTLAPIVADHYFTIPDEKLLGDLEEGRIIEAQELEPHGVFLLEVAQAYKYLFRTICKRFSTQGSERVQGVEIQEIAALFRHSEASTSVVDSGLSSISILGGVQRCSKHGSSPEEEGNAGTPTASTCSDSGPITPLRNSEPGIRRGCGAPGEPEVLLHSKTDSGELSASESPIPSAQDRE